RQITNLALHADGVDCRVHAHYRNLPGVGKVIPRQQFDYRSLSGTVGTKQAEDGSSVNEESYVGNAARRPVGFGDSPKFYHSALLIRNCAGEFVFREEDARELLACLLEERLKFPVCVPR